MSVSAAQLVAEVRTDGVDKTKSELSGVGSFVTNIGGMFKSGLGGALSFATDMAGKGLQFLGSQLEDSVKLAMNHQAVFTQTAQAIKSTGDASGMTATGIQGLAESMSKVTPFSEDMTESGENLLLTFTGIGKKTFPEATQTMLDMAQAMHTGPTQEAMLLGKALNDPATGLSALTRVGVTFSAQEKEQIKTMMAHNDVAGAQAVMLKELQTEFGGSAKAAGQTFAGALQILQNNLEDVKIKIGTALLPILSQLVGILDTDVLPIFDAVGHTIEAVAHYFSLFDLRAISYQWQQLTSAFSDALKPMAGIHDFTKDLSGGFSLLQNTLSQLIDGAIRGFADILSGLKLPIQVLGSAISEIRQNLGFLFGILQGIGMSVMNQFQGSVSGMGGTIKNILSGALFTLDDILIQVGYSIKDFGKFLEGVNISAVIGNVKQVVSVVGTDLKNAFAWFAHVYADVSPVSNIFDALSRHAQELGKWFQTSVVPALKQAEPGFAQLGKAALGLAPVIEKIADVVHNTFQKAFDALLPVFEKVVPVVIKLAGILADGLGKAIQFLTPYILQAVDAIGKFAGELIDRLAPIISEVADEMGKQLNFILKLWNAVWPLLAPVLKGVFDQIVGVIKIAWALVSGIIKVALDLLSGNWKQAWNDMKEMLAGVWNGIKQYVSGGVEIVKGLISGLVNGVVALFTHLADVLVGHSIIPDMINGIVSWIGQLPGRAMAFISSLVSQMTSTLGNLGSQALGWAEDMMNGFVSGIENGIGAIGNAVSNVASTISSHLHFSLPEKGPLANADTFMPDFMSLLAQGMDSNVGKVKASADKVAAAIGLSVNPNAHVTAASLSNSLATSVASSSGSSTHHSAHSTHHHTGTSTHHHAASTHHHAARSTHHHAASSTHNYAGLGTALASAFTQQPIKVEVTLASAHQPLLLTLNNQQFGRVVMPLIVDKIRQGTGAKI